MMRRIVRVVSIACVLCLWIFTGLGSGAGYGFPAPKAYAQSWAGSSQECGTYTWHEDLIKGRTDGMVVHVHHTEGCFTYDYTNLVGADAHQIDTNPTRERAWQKTECQRWGKEDTVAHFRYYRNLDINPDDVQVTCTLYHGPD